MKIPLILIVDCDLSGSAECERARKSMGWCKCALGNLTRDHAISARLTFQMTSWSRCGFAMQIMAYHFYPNWLPEGRQTQENFSNRCQADIRGFSHRVFVTEAGQSGYIFAMHIICEEKRQTELNIADAFTATVRRRSLEKQQKLRAVRSFGQ